MSIAATIAIFALLALAGFAAYVRFAPSDPAHWHADPGPGDVGPCDRITTTAKSARVSCLHPETPQTLLSRLDAIARQTPRTTRLAGSSDTGRITWITRTALWGFPDFTTAQATVLPDGTRLDIFARTRFGGGDFGVNGKRLRLWMTKL